ncbi:proline/glycine betaine ABC transporter permease [Herbaspirillum sp. GW103]|uniref:ABC transporter permease n=1 Tax=unclassified Herbaspirillum TaxID=2624150 RepID=UPI00025E2682|nr:MULTISPECIES: ABC transporter permease [unclassified Herbaspirillum]EIJ46902.1 proline/glycine betaine ABC transporter permease [Herbaspirillum sp. GW103]MCI1003971.1 ABC transporter permease [Herbaspirillum sp. C7C8]
MTRVRHVFAGALGFALVIAGLVWWIGPDVIHKYRGDLVYYTGKHLELVFSSMVLALLTGIPAGIALSRPGAQRSAEKFIQIFNIGNTIPSIAVLALALAAFGIGNGPTILALWLASLLPIVRNTYEGLKNVPAAMKEAARGIGMKPYQILLRVELPNALPIIVGGVRTALAINVGSAPLSMLIGGESLGGLIFPGIYLNNHGQLLLGASATALLALVLDALVTSLSGFYLARRGLRA